VDSTLGPHQQYFAVYYNA